MTESSPAAVLIPNLLWRTLHWPCWAFCRTWLRVNCSGLENLDNTRGGMLLVNHQSFLDPLLAAMWLTRPVSYLARDSLFRVPVLGWLLRRTYAMPISREAARGGSIRLAVERMDQGFLIGIFPEGTRSSGTEVRDFRPGFLAMVRRTNQPVYPVGIAGADRVMPRGAWFIRPGKIQVVYGAPFTPEEMAGLQSGDDAAFCELARQRVSECVALAERQMKGEPVGISKGH
ncbi:MAG: 1-acyl-sn-glycerol-3-phosphate acyltransferase [Fuerstia sp.]|nr:1-acyl-sn-glycerol-3-phosphate acyltransferase [Fuerstiella sp.]